MSLEGGGVSPLLSQLENALQARESIAAADISMGLLHAQSQMGLSSQGPLSARALAGAALQVNCALFPCLSLSPSHAGGASRTCSQPLSGDLGWTGDVGSASTMQHLAVQASRAGSSAAESQQVSPGGHVSRAAATLLVFRILALAGQQLNGTARSAHPQSLV